VLDELLSGLSDADELLAMAVEEDDPATVAEVENDIGGFRGKLEALEFRRMFSGELDANNAYLDIWDCKTVTAWVLLGDPSLQLGGISS